MCGIAGYFVNQPDRVSAKTLQQLSRNLLSCIETRGRDATGYAYVSQRDKTIHLAKAPVDATAFLHINSHLLTRSNVKSMPRALILHTRAATQGDPIDNRNNHPIFSKKSALCIVHNGWISNDTALLKEHKIDQDAEVDSEVYLRLIEHMYTNKTPGSMEAAVKAATKEVYGSLACAMIQGGRPDTMWIWKDTGALYMVEMDWGWVFASTKEAVLKSVLAACSTINGIIAEYIDPLNSTMYTITSKSVTITKDIQTASWQSRGTRRRGVQIWKDGKLVNVPASRFDMDNDSWEDYGDYDEGWNYFHNASRTPSSPTSAHQSNLFAVVEHGAGAADSGATGGTDSKSASWQNTPTIKISDRDAWRARHEKNVERNKCFCRPDYVCVTCRPQNWYYQHPNTCKIDDLCTECKAFDALNAAIKEQDQRDGVTPMDMVN